MSPSMITELTFQGYNRGNLYVTTVVKTEARAAGISWATVRRASDALGIRKRKVQDSWYWDRPNLLTQLAQDAQRSNVGQVEQVDEQDGGDDVPLTADIEVF